MLKGVLIARINVPYITDKRDVSGPDPEGGSFGPGKALGPRGMSVG